MEEITSALHHQTVSTRKTPFLFLIGKRHMMEVGQIALYEMVIVIGIAVVLVAAVIGSLVARIMMGSEERALLREARQTHADIGDLTRRIGS